MKAFLCSETISGHLIPEFEKLLGSSSMNKKVAFIPTATNSPLIIDNSWVDERIMQIENDLQVGVLVVDIEKYSTEELYEILYQADIIWINGGMAGYLMRKIRESGLDQILTQLLENEGKIYVGSSTGSMVLASELSVATWFIGEPEPIDENDLQGLGYINFDFYPHYEPGNQKLMDEIKAHYKGHSMFVLTNDEAIIIDGEYIKVIGEIRHLTGEQTDFRGLR